MNVETTVNIRTARAMLKVYRDNRIPTFLWGAPGIGKSEVIASVAREEGIKLIDFRAALRNPVDLMGIPSPDKAHKNTVWLTPSELPNEKRDGKRGILFLDELNTASPQVQNACLGLVLDRRIGDYVLPEGWDIVAAGNRQSDRTGVQRMMRALANRFAHIDVEPDHKVWIEDYGLENCEPILTAFVHAFPQHFHNMETSDERKYPTARGLSRINKMLDQPKGIRYLLVSGIAGKEAAIDLEAFFELWGSMPDIDAILDDPDSVDVPDKVSMLYAISTALSRNADRSNFKNALSYARRMGVEYETVVALEATKVTPSLLKTKAYVDFTKRNKDVSLPGIE